jgi:hypothetical protein
VPDESRPAFAPDWQLCGRETACVGAVVFDDACLAHLAGELNAYLKQLRSGARLDARGAKVTGELIERVLGHLPDGTRIVGAAFDHASIAGPVRFDGVVFDGTVTFRHTTFDGDASFDEATFARPLLFENVDVEGTLSFVNARFEKRAWLGPLTAEELNIARLRCAAMTEIDVRVARLNARLARFEEGTVVRADGGMIFAEKTRFSAPSLIAGTGALPRLRSLRATDVSNLELADVDLRWCAFAGAHRLDQLRFAGRCPFDRPPPGLRRTRRRTIAEEAAWRGWSTDRPATWEIEAADPERMANVYRSLRKAFEDSKNEAGAGDFYYGEMEMRRHSAETPRAERAILWVYWLLSGYGQRAARAVAALLVVIAVVGALLAGWGQPAAEAARIAVGAVVLREPGAELTAAGQWTVMVARVLGPVLLALAVLAVRARVKR